MKYTNLPSGRQLNNYVCLIEPLNLSQQVWIFFLLTLPLEGEGEQIISTVSPVCYMAMGVKESILVFLLLSCCLSGSFPSFTFPCPLKKSSGSKWMPLTTPWVQRRPWLLILTLVVVMAKWQNDTLNKSEMTTRSHPYLKRKGDEITEVLRHMAILTLDFPKGYSL